MIEDAGSSQSSAAVSLCAYWQGSKQSDADSDAVQTSAVMLHYCNLQLNVRINWKSDVAHELWGPCNRSGYNGDGVIWNGELLFGPWNHHGDPDSLPTSGGGNIADCDDAWHSHSYWASADCGYGEIFYYYYADFGVMTDQTPINYGNLVSYDPCLPSPTTGLTIG